jgi:hypothetical protein
VLLGIAAYSVLQRPREIASVRDQATSHLRVLQERSESLTQSVVARVQQALAGWRQGQRYTVTVASVPSGATVQLGGAELGKTPYQLQLKSNTEIELSLPGHRTQNVTVDPDGDPNLVVNLVPLPPYRAASRSTR